MDGDTFVADVDLGFGAHIWITVRLHGVNAPEHNTPEGPPATAYLTGLLGNKQLRLESFKDRQSFARWVCDVWVLWPERTGPGPGRWDSVSERIIAAGHGVPFMVGP